MARPRKEIDAEQFEKLCALQCTLEEIAGWFNCSEDTIERWCEREYERGFADVYAEKRQGGKIVLRRAQFELAKKSAAMAIFLGKNWLGQRDNVVYEDKESISRLDAILEQMRMAAGAEPVIVDAAATDGKAE